MRERRDAPTANVSISGFNSRSREGATSNDQNADAIDKVSIHAPVRERPLIHGFL